MLKYNRSKGGTTRGRNKPPGMGDSMTIYAFAKQVWESCIDPDLLARGYTAEEAAADLENFRAAGWDLPDDISPADFAEAMNEVIAEAQQ